MRIAYLSTDFGIPVHGAKGAAVHVRELCRALAALGHEVRVYTPRSGGPPPADFGVTVREVPLDAGDARAVERLAADPEAGPAAAAAVRAMLYAGGLGHRLAAEMEAFRPDCVYERYALFGTAGLALARARGIPLLLEVNAPLADEQAAHRSLAFAAAARAAERELLAGADHVVAVSDAVGAWAEAQGADRSRVTVLPNAVDPARFVLSGAERARLRSRLGVLGRPVIGFVGSLKAWHDVPTLIQAVRLLHRQGVEAHLLVVGDGPERARLDGLVAAAGLAGSTTFTGAVPHAEVARWLAAMDLTVAPYGPAAGFYFSPLKLYEYMAAGRPVVAADIGQIRGAVRHGITGLLYPPGDAEALAGAVETLAADPALAAMLGESGRAWVRRHRTWAGNAAQVVALATAHRRERAA